MTQNGATVIDHILLQIISTPDKDINKAYCALMHLFTMLYSVSVKKINLTHNTVVPHLKRDIRLHNVPKYVNWTNAFIMVSKAFPNNGFMITYFISINMLHIIVWSLNRKLWLVVCHNFNTWSPSILITCGWSGLINIIFITRYVCRRYKYINHWKRQ